MKVAAAPILPIIVGCALFMQMLDATVVTIALPALAHALDEPPVRLNIVMTSYLVAAALFVPLSGWAADRFGARRVFTLAIIIFTLSSIACAASTTLEQLVAGRLAQGLGGAMMVPVGRIILLRAIPKSELVRAMSFLTVPALLGPMIGPPLGGLLLTVASWQWIFLINVPIGVLGVFLVRRFIPRTDDDAVVAPPLDLLGFLLSGGSLTAVVFGLDIITHGGWPPEIGGGILLGGLILGGLYILHARRCANPIVDLDLLRIPTFSISIWAGNLCRFSIGALPFLLVMLLQVGLGKTPLAAGLITFAGAAGALLLKFWATGIIQRYGFRRVLTVNGVLTGLMLLACAAFSASTPYWVMVGVLFLGGIFRSLQLTAINTLNYADVTKEAMSRASSFSAMAQQVAISLGVAIAAITINLSMRIRGHETLDPVDVMAGFLVIGALVTLSGVMFRRLDPRAGEEVSAGRPAS